MDNFVSALDIKDIHQTVEDAIQLKHRSTNLSAIGQGKNIVLLFLNPSLRTRLSSQRAAQLLGMHVICMNMGTEGWQLEFEDGAIMDAGKAEHAKDAAKVVSQYADVIAIRSFANLKNKEEDYSEKVINAFVKYATVPIINMESSTVHPLQSLADMITIREHCRIKDPKIVLSWAPHPKALPQAVANSFAQWILQSNQALTIVQPKGFELSEKFTQNANIEYDQNEAFKDADIIYTKNWSSFEDYGAVGQFKNWTVDANKMKLTNDAYFMHCLPIRRNVVVSDEVLDAPKSLVIEQANNRTFSALHVIKSLITS